MRASAASAAAARRADCNQSMASAAPGLPGRTTGATARSRRAVRFRASARGNGPLARGRSSMRRSTARAAPAERRGQALEQRGGRALRRGQARDPSATLRRGAAPAAPARGRSAPDTTPAVQRGASVGEVGAAPRRRRTCRWQPALAAAGVALLRGCSPCRLLRQPRDHQPHRVCSLAQIFPRSLGVRSLCGRIIFVVAWRRRGRGSALALCRRRFLVIPRRSERRLTLAQWRRNGGRAGRLPRRAQRLVVSGPLDDAGACAAPPAGHDLAIGDSTRGLISIDARPWLVSPPYGHTPVRRRRCRRCTGGRPA